MVDINDNKIMTMLQILDSNPSDEKMNTSYAVNYVARAYPQFLFVSDDS